jgi:hypothetical protein
MGSRELQSGEGCKGSLPQSYTMDCAVRDTHRTAGHADLEGTFLNGGEGVSWNGLGCL